MKDNKKDLKLILKELFVNPKILKLTEGLHSSKINFFNFWI
jgi:hypothetical protein